MMRKILLVIGLLLLAFGLFFGILENPLKYLLQSKTYLKSGKVARAIENLEIGVNKFPNDHNLILELAKAYYLAGEVESSNNKVIVLTKDKSLSGRNDFKNLLVCLSEANHNLGNEKYAKYFAMKYLEFDDKNKFAKQKAKNLLRIGQILPTKSIELWEDAYNIAHAAGDLELKQSLKALLLPKYLQISDQYRSSKKYKKALEVLDKSEILGKSAVVEIYKARLYTELRNLNDAQKHYEESLQADPDNNDLKIEYAEFLRKAVLFTKEQSQKNIYLEKAKLILSGSDNPKNVNLLNKILSLNAKYKIVDSMFQLKLIGEYSYPSLIFKIAPLSESMLEKCKIVFFDGHDNVVDEQQEALTDTDLNQLLELTSTVAVSEGIVVNAKLYLNDEFVKDYKITNEPVSLGHTEPVSN